MPPLLTSRPLCALAVLGWAVAMLFVGNPPDARAAPQTSPAADLVELQDGRDWGAELVSVTRPALEPEPAAVELVDPLAFDDGFASLAELVDMGRPIEAPAVNPDDGAVVQLTTAGLAYWLPDDNLPAFTDGYHRWALDGRGLVDWTGPNLTPPAPAPAPARGLLPTTGTAGSPREYLYGHYPAQAARIDCLARHESGWNATVVNRTPVGREHATGLLQYLPSTWLSTPQGRAGASIYDPYAQIDATVYMLSAGRAREWATIGYC